MVSSLLDEVFHNILTNFLHVVVVLNNLLQSGTKILEMRYCVKMNNDKQTGSDQINFNFYLIKHLLKVFI